MRLEPISVRAAMRQVQAWHRHLPELHTGMFAVQCVADNGQCVGVAGAGSPARVWNGTGRLVISRVATDGHANACSMLYGSLCRAAKALGYREVWTYTLPEEPGTSLRAAGFVDMGLTAGGEWCRPSRYRPPAKRPEPKRRWRRQLHADGARPAIDVTPREKPVIDERPVIDVVPGELPSSECEMD